MQAKKRYLLLFVSCAFLAYWYFGGYRLKSNPMLLEETLPIFIELNKISTGKLPQTAPQNNQFCSMETCFDFDKCKQDFRVFVYPSEGNTVLSPSYQKLLNALMESRYYTADPRAACLFVLSIDTLDRDRLSNDYVRNIQARLQRLPHWNNGRNHVIFNLYSGTWPNYTENNLDFDYG